MCGNVAGEEEESPRVKNPRPNSSVFTAVRDRFAIILDYIDQEI
jgi:hypothetical protein